MKNLQLSQKLFSAVLDLKSIEEGFAAEKFNQILKENDCLPGRVAMAIYRNNSIGARQQTLRHIYPVIEKILGDQCFTMMTKDFVTAEPSLDADLNNFGDGFADFLVDQISIHSAFADFNYLPDLARLEWVYHAAYYVDDASDDKDSSDFSSVSQFDEYDKALYLICSSAMYPLSTVYPVYDIWQAHQAESLMEEVPALTAEDHLLVYRQQNHPQIERISKHESITLQIFYVSREIDSAIDILLEKGVDVQQLLPAMIQKGWLRVAVQQDP